MKTKIQTGKKVLSVFLAVLMVMTAWVFVAPTEAEAAEYSTYNLTITYYTQNKVNSGYVRIKYKPNNGTGTEVWWNNSSKTGSSSAVENSITTSNNSDTKTVTFNLPGWPTFIDFCIKTGNTGTAKFGIKGISCNEIAIHTGSYTYSAYRVTNLTWHRSFTPSSASGGAATSGLVSDSGDGGGSQQGTWNWPKPAVTYVDSAPSDGTINVPKSGSATGSFTATFKDQYKVAMAGSGATAEFNPAIGTGATIAMSGNTATVTAGLSVFDNLSNYSTSTGKGSATLKITNNGVVASCTVTFQAPKFNLKFQNLDGTALYNQDHYYKAAVDCATIASGLTNSIKPIDGDDNNHQHYKWDTTKYVTNLTADTVITEIADYTSTHSYGSYTQGDTTHSRVCSVCGYTESHEHTRGEGYVTKDETCTEDGVMTYDCSVCGKKAIATEAINDITGHNFTDYVDNGDGTHSKKCSRCGALDGIKVEHVPTYTQIDENSHKFKCQTCTYEAVVAHTENDWVYSDDISDATCTEDGETEYVCIECGIKKTVADKPATGHSFTTYYSDDNATCCADGTKTATCDNCDVTDTVADEGSKLPHSYTAVVTDPTCEVGGYTTYTCHGVNGATCGDTYKDNYVNAIGHDWELIDHKDETCTEDGYNTYKCKNDGTHQKTDVIKAPGHTVVVVPETPATCTTTGLTEHRYCSVCGEVFAAQTVIPVLGHNYVGVETKAPTCTDPGVMTYTCQNDPSHTYTTDITPLGHIDGNGDNKCDRCGAELCTHEGYDRELIGYKAPTCTETGSTGYYKCLNCGGPVTTAEEIPATGHTPGAAATCTTAQYCTVCGVQLEAPLGHSAAEAVKENIIDATCTTDGSYESVVYCSRENCKFELSRTTVKVNALTHSFGEVVAAKDTSCLAPGNYAYKQCEICKLYFAADDNDTLSENGKADNTSFIIPQLDHSYTGAIRNDKDNDVNGTHSYLCVNGCNEYGGTVPHTWNEGDVDVQVDCFTDGKVFHTCTAEGCGATYTETIDKYNHSRKKHTPAVEVTDVCLSKGNLEYWECPDCLNVYTDEACTQKLEDKTDANRNNIPDALETTGPDHEYEEEWTPYTPGPNGQHYRKCKNYEKCKTYSKAEPHNYALTGETTATCTQAGEEVYTCTDCGEVYKEQTSEKIPHTFTEDDAIIAATAATCFSKGNNEYYQCDMCNKYFTDITGATATTPKNEELAVRDHEWSAEHDFDTKIADATCVSPAVYNKHCDYCEQPLVGVNATYTKGTADENAHKFEGETVSVDATHHAVKCIVDGCTATDTAVECSITQLVEDTASTCKTYGKTVKKCTACTNRTEVQKPLDSTNHEGGTEVVGAIDATCAVNGFTGKTNCLGCGAELDAGEVIEADPKVHPHENMQPLDGVDSTCQVPGYSSSRKCSACGTVEESAEVIPVKPHTFDGEWEQKTDAEGTKYHERSCSTCVDDAANNLIVATEKANCSGGTANCVDKAVCSTCNGEYGDFDRTNHKEEVTIDKVDSTCQKVGYEAYKHCNACGIDTETKKEIALKVHNYGGGWTQIEKDGKKYHQRSCTTCKAADGTVSTTEELCSGGTAYCDRLATCTVCKNSYGEKDPAKHASTDTKVVDVVAATCTSKGYTGDTLYACCNALKEAGKDTDKLDHNCNIEVVSERVPSTCITQGSATYKCANCDETRKETLPLNSTNHKGEVETIAEVPATCQTTGTTAYKKCKDCNANITEPKTIAAKAHSWTEWTRVQGEESHRRTCTTCVENADKNLTIASQTANCSGGKATCQTKAICSTCGVVYGTVDPTNHASTETKVVGKTEATCQKAGYSGDVYYTCCYDENATAEENLKALKSAGSAVTVNHYFSEVVSEVPATCKTKGSITYKCSTCVESEGVTAAQKTVTIDENPGNHEGKATVIKNAVAATCVAGGYTGDKYYSCCDALAQKGYETKPLSTHNYSAAVPEYLYDGFEETKDADGNVTSRTVKVKTDNLTYEQKIAARRADGYWYHFQVCLDCGKVLESKCSTFEHTANCVETDKCSVCAGLCSLVDLKSHKGTLRLVPEVPSTCDKQGTIAYYVCDACGKSFFDEAGQKLVTNADDLKADVTVQHNIDTTVPATSNNDGTHSFKCEDCDKPVIVDCAGGEATCQKKAECSVCGAEYGEKDEKNHESAETVLVNYKAATCGTKGYTGDSYYKCCYVEGAEDNSKALKAFGKETDPDPALHVKKLVDNNDGTHSEICEGCKKVFSTVDHIWVAGKVPENVSCENGYDLDYTCECGATKKETVAPAGHDYAEAVSEKAATCTAAGSKTITKTCKVCGDVVTSTETIAALGHDNRTIKGVPATCSSDGTTDYIYCNRCDIVVQESTKIPATGCEDANHDGFCDSCHDTLYENADGTNCNCICHKQNVFMKFIYKILRFFWKLFKIEKSCCSAGVHY